MNRNGYRDYREKRHAGHGDASGLLKPAENFSRARYVECVQANVASLRRERFISDKVGQFYIEQAKSGFLPEWPADHCPRGLELLSYAKAFSIDHHRRGSVHRADNVHRNRSRATDDSAASPGVCGSRALQRQGAHRRPLVHHWRGDCGPGREGARGRLQRGDPRARRAEHNSGTCGGASRRGTSTTTPTTRFPAATSTRTRRSPAIVEPRTGRELEQLLQVARGRCCPRDTPESRCSSTCRRHRHGARSAGGPASSTIRAEQSACLFFNDSVVVVNTAMLELAFKAGLPRDHFGVVRDAPGNPTGQLFHQAAGFIGWQVRPWPSPAYIKHALEEAQHSFRHDTSGGGHDRHRAHERPHHQHAQRAVSLGQAEDARVSGSRFPPPESVYAEQYLKRVGNLTGFSLGDMVKIVGAATGRWTMARTASSAS